MKGNVNICHELLCTNETVQVNISGAHMNNSKGEKLLVIKIDCKLSLGDHVGNIC